ncbi:zinc-binding dehydrogenase family protein [Yersinia rohdei]|uniref:Zinc-binding dehydrogenase family protein n=1 Tax=Yersinia rohdei TaxID=29485 RepID=A0ABN4F965_YERRO|nr:SDR family NAD(P)-dependent oxidoreductase [Yersinia rohdei]AJJ12396.1 zinc-binding dehydrogenase family protein [Yersinia rohdei]EEQ01120.1 Polyketide synthase [Yersinia rohdei ATCC 43380]
MVDKNQEWPATIDNLPRLGGVNSFGAGGTNAHVVIEEYVPDTEIIVGLQEAEDIQPEVNLFTCSAATEEALKAQLTAYRNYLSNTELSLNDLCFNAGQHRSSLLYRIAIACRSLVDLQQKIDSYLNGEQLIGVEIGQESTKKPRLAFIFTGQGPQWYAMGRQLIETEPVFRHVVEKIGSLFQKIAGWSLLEEMERPESDSRINDTRIAQPAIMALQIALVELWKHNGVKPDGVIGHSIGEIAAAYTAGALTLEQAVQVVYHRSRGQHTAANLGAMLAIGLSQTAAESLIAEATDHISIAAVNGPESITLTGDKEPLDAIARQLETQEIFHRFLKVDVPFHSYHMEPLKDELINSLSELTPSPSQIPLYSTVTGNQEDGRHLVAAYWYHNVRDPVYFAPGLAKMLEDGFDTFIEIGPHPALSSDAQELFTKMNIEAYIFPSIRRKEDEPLRLKQTLAALQIAGYPMDWHKVCPGALRRFDLPRYVWQQKHFWHESLAQQQRRLQLRLHPHITLHQDSGISAEKHTFSLFLDPLAEPYLSDHRVTDMIVFPGAGHMEVATAAAQKAFGDAFSGLTDIHFDIALFLPEDGEMPEIMLEVYSQECRFQIMSRERGKADAAWVQNSKGFMNCLDEKPAPPVIALADIQREVNEPLSPQPMYTAVKRAGLAYGPMFKIIQNFWTAPNKLLAKIVRSENLQYGIEHFLLHPTLFDACIHSLYATRRLDANEELGLYLPIYVKRYNFFQRPQGSVLWCYLNIYKASDQVLHSDAIVMDDSGTVVAQMIGVQLKYIAGSREHDENTAYSGCYEYEWQPLNEPILSPQLGTDILLVTDNSSENNRLIQALLETGANVITLGEAQGADWQIDLQDRKAVLTAISEIKNRYPTLSRIVNALPWRQTGDENLSSRIETLIWQSVNLNHAIIENELLAVVWTLNCGSDLVIPDDKQLNLVQAPLYGLSRTMNNEYPFARCKIIDLGDGGEQELAVAAALMASIDSGGNETEIALRDGQLFVHRLNKVIPLRAQQAAAKALTGCGSYYQARLAEPMNLNSVEFNQFAPPRLAANEVEIAVKAAALAAKDPLAEEMSQECAGVITRIGSAVSHFNVGDEVIAITGKGIAGMAVAAEHCLVHKPAQLSFEQGAILPLDYLTAYYGLYTLAHMQSGDKVLIHCATQGIGIAAIHLARRSGAEIFATTDSEAKRVFLWAMGVPHVYDSNKLNFHQQILTDTTGEGVDIVLNSLGGKSVVQSLKSLRPFGRFIEINPGNIAENDFFLTKLLEKNLSYSVVDINTLMHQRPLAATELFSNVIALFNNDRPLQSHPFTVFPVPELQAALAYRAKELQVGKVVINMDGYSVNALPALSLHLKANKIYLITAGASGLGIELAKWLVDKGARKLALASRSGPKNDYDRHTIAQLQQQGVEIFLPEVDVNSATAVSNMVAQLKTTAPIGGVIHAAALMQTALIKNMERADLLPAISAKAFGAWNLHQALRHDPLDFFLSISSIASVFGLAGQSSYAAANNFLDKLTRYRQLQGLTAQSVNLGLLGTFAGISKNSAGLVSSSENQGWISMSQKQVTAKLERIILDGGVVRMAANVDWVRFRDNFDHLRTDLRFAHLLSDESLNIKSKAGSDDSLREKIQLLNTEDAVQTIKQYLIDALARILGNTADKIDAEKSLSAMGLDSLMMNQLRHWIQLKLEINYPLMRMVKGPSLSELAAQLQQELVNTKTPQVLAGDTSGITTEDDIEVLHKWFVRRKRAEGEKPKKIKLFMMPSMGAGASMFAHFLYHPPGDCEVYAIQSPGRENRIDEPNYTQIPPLLADLESALDKLLAEEKQQYGWDGERVFYGHSYGGIIMFELYRSLRAKKQQLPIHFFVSATMAPQLTGTWREVDVMRASADSSASEQKILGLMRYIDDVEFVKQILPGIRRDMPLLLSYEYQDEEPLSCPITVFSAIEDDVTRVDEMAQWKSQTTASFKQYLVHGDHWFVSRNKEFIAKEIAENLGEQ